MDDAIETVEFDVVDRNLQNYNGDVWHVRLDRELEVLNRAGNLVATTRWFVVSGIVAPWFDIFGGGPETYIFASDEDGNVVAWGELSGSFRGAIDHERALREFLRAIDTDTGTVA